MSLDYNLEKFYDTEKFEECFDDQLNTDKRYTDFSEIGEGGIKKVYKVFDVYSQRFVAYAQLRKEYKDSLSESFIREARLTAKLSHPNIIPVYDVGVCPDNGPFFTMELKQGEDLGVILEQADDSKHSLNYLLKVFLKVCDGISFAHSKKVIHLDLKPDNIQVGTYGEVMICDWGLGKICGLQEGFEDINHSLLNPDELNNMTIHGQIKGTPGFMAPEQILGEEKDERTDIYALGCILYSIPSKKRPLSGEVEQILKDTLTGNIPPLNEISDKSIPESLNAVCMKALSRQKLDRYQTVSSLKSDIENFLDGYVTEAEEAGYGKIFRLLIKRNKFLSLVTVCTALLIILSTTFFIHKIKERETVALKNQELYKNERDKAQAANEATAKANIQAQNHMVKLAESHFETTYTGQTIFDLRDTMNQLKELLENYPENKRLHSALGYHYFIMQDFETSLKFLFQEDDRFAGLISLAEKYRSLKGDKETLSSEDFFELIKSIRFGYNSIHLKMTNFYSEKTGDIDTEVRCLQYLFERLNPEWSEKVFKYDKTSMELTIGGKNFVVFKQGLLNHLPLKRLIVSNTTIDALHYTEWLTLEELDIAGTPISIGGSNNIRRMRTLRKLYVDKQQLKEYQQKHSHKKFPFEIILSDFYK